MADIETIAQAFEDLFAWIKEGTITDRLDDKPYRWKRGPWEASVVARSPAGPFDCIRGPRTVVYRRPDHSERVVGWMKYLDFRALTTPDEFAAMVAQTVRRDGARATVAVVVSGPVGSGKSRIANEIRTALQAVGVKVQFERVDQEREADDEASAEASGQWQPDWPDVYMVEVIAG